MLCRHRQCAALRHRVGRVHEQVPEDLSQLTGVPENAKAPVAAAVYPDVLSVRGVPEHFHRLAYERTQVYRVLQLPRGLREKQVVGYELVEPFRLAQDYVHELAAVSA